MRSCSHPLQFSTFDLIDHQEVRSSRNQGSSGGGTLRFFKLTLFSYNNQLQGMPGTPKASNNILKRAAEGDRSKVEAQKQQISEEELGGDKNEASDGKWTEEQNLRFTIFVQYYQDIFTSKHKRKICKIFKTLSEYLDSRSATQCRSHYQKMMEKHRSITKLKKYYRDLTGDSHYRRQYDAFKVQWEQSHQPMTVTHPQIKESREFAMQTEPVEPQPVCRGCWGRERGMNEGVQPAEGLGLPQQLVYYCPGQVGQMMSNGYYVMMMPTQDYLPRQ